MTLQTPRLELIPALPEHLIALREGITPFEQASGLIAAEGLRDYLVSDDVSPEWLAELHAARGSDPWKFGFFICERSDRRAIGCTSFVGPPDASGAAEIAYAIVPASQGHGYATEAARALIAFAADSGRATRLLAHTRAEPNASTRVLEKCGFARTGEISHPTDGLIWRWERACVEAPPRDR
jgi:RimJ/RimL family protein N-acetyltransferase